MTKLTRDEVAAYIFSANHAMPHNTYVLSLILDWMEKHIKDLSNHDLRYLIEESEQTLKINRTRTILDMRLQVICRKELERRGE